jgi:hypothetical protein
MYDWNFNPDHQITLTLSADARLSPTDYTNDQIWELNFGNSEPPALSLQTTFGLRARICRIFPRFIFNGQVINNPTHFYHPITIHQYYPNYISLSFKPFSCVNVIIEYWVPGSHAIAGRSKIINITHEPCQIQLDWAELLVPGPDGNRMATNEIGLTTVLSGQIVNLNPVLFLTGGALAGKSPYPSLNLSYDIPPHGEQESQWAHVTLPDMNASYQLAKEIINTNWDAEFAHISRINSQQIQINTGNQDWNNAFYLAQTIANQLILQPTQLSKAASYIYTRNPDQGFSLLKDGSDYNHLWNGQTTLDTYYLTNFILPASPELLKGMLDNFLATQTLHGEIDWKSGLGGQRSQLLATPLLAYMSWQYYEYADDIKYLSSVFPKLLNFFFSWFTSAHDRDNDLIPEWDQSIQTGYEEHPQFSYTYPWSAGIDISTVESPDLISYLYRECQSLISITKLLKNSEETNRLERISDQLKSMVEQSWSDHHACYLYRDRDSHISTQAEFLGKIMGSGVMEIHKELLQPLRPTIHFNTKRKGTLPVQIFIHGITTTGSHRIDHIPTNRMRWHLGSGFVTSEYLYKTIEKIEVTGISDDVEVIAQSASLTSLDQTLLLPLWAGIPSEDKAKILINLTIMNKKKLLSPFGLRSCSDMPGMSDFPEDFFGIHLPLITLVLDGLVRYGERKKAADIFTRLMKAVVQSFRIDLKFHQYYHSETGKPLGTINSLTSLIPIGLFLNIAGVKIISPSKVEISGNNPFPWPVTLKYRGLTLVQQEKKALIIFPDGQNITVDNNHTQIISVDKPR